MKDYVFDMQFVEDIECIKSSLSHLENIGDNLTGLTNLNDMLSDTLSGLRADLLYQNNLLKKLCFYFEKQLNYQPQKSNLSIDCPDIYRNKNLLIAGATYGEAYAFVKRLTEPSTLSKSVKGEPKIVTAENSLYCSRSDLAAALTNAGDGDYLLLNYNELSESALDLLIGAIRDNELNLIVGKGTNAREISFSLKTINYVIYAEFLETVNPELKKLCEVIK